MCDSYLTPCGEAGGMKVWVLAKTFGEVGGMKVWVTAKTVVRNESAGDSYFCVVKWVE